jgi:hypothetical protein
MLARKTHLRHTWCEDTSAHHPLQEIGLDLNPLMLVDRLDLS